MSTTKTEILATAQMLCFNLADPAELDRLFTEVLIELAQDPRLWMCGVTNSPIDAVGSTTDATVVLDTQLNLVGAFYDGRQLSAATQKELEAGSTDWRDQTGAPFAYTMEENAGDRVLRLFPRRTDRVTSGTSFSTLASLLTTTDIPELLQLPLALRILGREFARETMYRDLAFAEGCNAIAKHILDMIA